MRPPGESGDRDAVAKHVVNPSDIRRLRRDGPLIPRMSPLDPLADPLLHDDKIAGLLWGLVRTVLLLTVIPPLVTDRDLRGLHDRAANTIVIRL